MKKTTSKIFKAMQWINRAVRDNESRYFRFVGFENGKNIYGEWLTPEMAHRELPKHNIYNTLKIEMMEY